MTTLVIETAGPACSVALVDAAVVVAHAHELVGRGHAERLLPMIATLPNGGRAERIWVDCGPGSFTGVRVGLAAARGLGLGWGVPVEGFSSLALLAGAFAGDALIAIPGGHGELFCQPFRDGQATGPLASMTADAAAADQTALIVGDASDAVRAIRGWGTALARTLDARDAIALRAPMVPPSPIYGRAPDAVPMRA